MYGHSRLAGMDLNKPLDSGLRRNDGRGVIPVPPPFRPPSSFQRKLACMDARLRGCRAFGELSRAVVEPRREQAAEVVPIPLLWRGARQGGVVEPRLKRRPRNAGERAGVLDEFRLVFVCTEQTCINSPGLSFPLSGNALNKPLDSSAFVPDAALPPASMQASFRWNDGRRIPAPPSFRQTPEATPAGCRRAHK